MLPMDELSEDWWIEIPAVSRGQVPVEVDVVGVEPVGQVHSWQRQLSFSPGQIVDLQGQAAKCSQASGIQAGEAAVCRLAWEHC